MKKALIIIIIFFSNISILKADEATEWLSKELNIILEAYQNENLSKMQKFKLIENTINNNFAGAGIARFVAGKAWNSALKETKKEYIELFKRHLALSIASMMQGYSNQKYSLINSKHDSSTNVSLIDMEIKSDTGKFLVTWRLKKSKDRYFVIDLLVADISLVITKRSEFNSMLKKENYNLKKFNQNLKDQNQISYNKFTN